MTSPKKVRVATPTIQVRVYPLVADAVESGVRYGWHRAHKHVARPKEDLVVEAITNAVLNELCELMVMDPAAEPPVAGEGTL